MKNSVYQQRPFIKVLCAYGLVIVLSLNARSETSYQISSAELTILNQYLAGLQTSNITSADSQLLTLSWISSFNQQWPTATNGLYASGILLPTDVAALVSQMTAPYNDQTLASYLSNGASPLLTNQSEMDAFSGLVTVYADSVTNGIPDAVPRILNAHANSVPPTKGDIITYYIANVVIPSALPCKQISATQMAEWNSLSRCSNAIYRVIAAQAFSKIIEPTSWPNFYASYANETDPNVATVAINILWNSALKSNISVLQQIEQGQQNLGNTLSANNAAQAIKKLQIYGH